MPIDKVWGAGRDRRLGPDDGHARAVDRGPVDRVDGGGRCLGSEAGSLAALPPDLRRTHRRRMPSPSPARAGAPAAGLPGLAPKVLQDQGRRHRGSPVRGRSWCRSLPAWSQFRPLPGAWNGHGRHGGSSPLLEPVRRSVQSCIEFVRQIAEVQSLCNGRHATSWYGPSGVPSGCSRRTTASSIVAPADGPAAGRQFVTESDRLTRIPVNRSMLLCLSRGSDDISEAAVRGCGVGVPTGLLLVCGQDRHPRSLKVSGELDFAGRPGGGFVVEGVRVLRHPCRMPTSRLRLGGRGRAGGG